MAQKTTDGRYVPGKYVTLAAKYLGLELNRLKQVQIFIELAAYHGEPYVEDKAHGLSLVAKYLDERHPGWDANLKKGKAKHPTIKKAKKKVYAPTPHPSSDDFLTSYEWRKLRMEVIKERGTTCECCGANAQRDRVRINVDHIKPRRQFPHLALDKSNLQVLCEPCNHGKGNWDHTDWREPEPSVMPMWHDPMRPRLVKKGSA